MSLGIIYNLQGFAVVVVVIYLQHAPSYGASRSSQYMLNTLLMWRFRFIICLKHAARQPPQFATTMSLTGVLKESICTLFLLARCHVEANLHGGLNKLGGGLTKQRKTLTGILLCAKDCRWVLMHAWGGICIPCTHTHTHTRTSQTLQINCVVVAVVV